MTTHHETIDKQTHLAGKRWHRVTDFLRAFARKLFPVVPGFRSISAVMATFVALGLVSSLIYLAYTPPTYTAIAVIGPTQEQFSPTPSNQLDRNAMSLLSGGGLFSGPRVITPYDAFLKTMQTREVARRLFADSTVLNALFPGAWDPASKTWKKPSGLTSAAVSTLYWIVGRAHPDAPSTDSVLSILRGRLDVSMIDRGPMYTLTFSSANREFATEFLNRVFVTTDQVIKERNRAEVLRRIQVLENRMQSLDVVDYRAQFTSLIMDQEKQLMLLQGSNEFAASMVVTPSAPDYPDNPRISVTIPIFVSLFFFLGVSVLVFVYRDDFVRQARLRVTGKSRG